MRGVCVRCGHEVHGPQLCTVPMPDGRACWCRSVNPDPEPWWYVAACFGMMCAALAAFIVLAVMLG